MSAWLYKEVFCSGDKRHYNVMGQYGSWFRRKLFHWRVLNPAIPSLGSLVAAGGLFQLAREGKKLRKRSRTTGKQLRRLHIWGFNVATGPGLFFSCNMQSPKVEKDLKWGCIMSRDLNWTIMISLFFRSFLQTRILRFSGETSSAKRVRGARHTRQGRRLYQSRLSTATSCFVRQMNGKI